MTIHAAIHSAKATTVHQSAPNSVFEHCAAARAEMSDRCLTVMELLTDGHSNKEIAARLRVSMATVKAYVSEILRALNVDNRTQAALIGLRLRYGLEIIETRSDRK
ncbi:MAG: LuxR C-terminal-related transcriptional regulator [Hyphomicrobiaceae bacterium]